MSIQFLGTKASNIKSFYFLQLKFKTKCSFHTLLKTRNGFWEVVSRRLLHDVACDSQKDTNNKFQSFLDIVEKRRCQAKRSILVQVQSAKSSKELYTYCSNFGGINEMLHYKAGKESMHFVVVEFQKDSTVEKVLNASHHIEDAHIVPVESSFLWFKASQKVTPKKRLKEKVSLSVENGNCVLSDKDLKNRLQCCDSISDQIQTLYNLTKLDDLGTRLRFLTARQIEVALSGIFPHAVAFPFGSSVNGYGKMNCDLDVVLKLSKNKVSDDSRLVYHCKASAGTERSASQRHMEAIGDLIHLFLPGCSQVRKILQARVPIIKYYQQLTDVECDFSMANMSGVYMSDLLHVWGSIDERVRPLVFVIKKWAEEVGLTNNFPGRWITNFSLTLLVLAFLQKPNNSPPVLPSLNSLVKSAGAKDKYFTEDGVDCSFLRDINKLKFKTQNKDSLELLLIQFFEYYSTFDFNSKAICLNQGAPITKPEHCALYIVNPLERGLNVSRNVSFEELERIRLEIRNAAWAVESQEKKTDIWGILSLFKNKTRQFPTLFSTVSVTPTNRLMDVTKIFEDENTKENEFETISNSEGDVENVLIEGMTDIKADQSVRFSKMKENMTKENNVNRNTKKLKEGKDSNEKEFINIHAKQKTGS